MNEKYELRTVADFFSVPTEKREACLHDFCLWLDVMDALRSLFGGIDGVRAQTEVFGWMDDGKHDAVVAVNIVKPPTDPPQGVSEDAPG